MNEQGKLAKFEQAIYSNAKKQAQAIISSAEEKSKAILDEAKRAAKFDSAAVVEQKKKKLLAGLNAEVSKASFSAQKAIIEKRTELVDSMFAEIVGELNQYTETAEYAAYLETAIKSVKDESVVIEVRPQDKSVTDKFSNGLKIKENNDIKIGGIRIVYANDGIIEDLTFDEAINEQKTDFISKSGLCVG